MRRRAFLHAAAAASAGALVRAEAEAAPAIIDAHVHVWKRDPRYPFTTKSTTPPPDRDAAPETLLALMRRHGVKKSVIVQVSHHGWDHRYVVEVLRKYPQHFIGMARVDPEDPAAPDQLEALCKRDGFRGLRLNVQPDPAFDWVRGPRVPALLRRCEKLGVPVGLQTKAARLPELLTLADACPELTVMIDHMADVPLDDEPGIRALLTWARRPRTFVKLSHTWLLAKEAYPYADAQTLVKRVYDAFGPQRLMFGSDWPGVDKFCGYARALALVTREMKFLTSEDRRHILHGTAAAVWRL